MPLIQNLKNIPESYWLYLLLPLILFFSFAKLNDQPIHQWDEARTGINAIEMLQNGDWINLHFADQPDKIRAKPPLVVWMVATNFQLFGWNTFSLRLHSAIATILIFLFLFRLIRLYEPAYFAFGVCMILLSVRAIVGFHVGRTGDFDAVLIAFLLAGLYSFLAYLDFDYKKGIYLAAIFWGLAFYTKGLAMGILFPGLLIFLLLRKRVGVVLQRKEVHWAVLFCLLFPLSWYTLIQVYGIQLEQPLVSGKNAFERMVFYDIVDRFTQSQFEGKIESADALFFFKCLRENYRYWDWVFYGTCLLGVVLLLKKRNTLGKIPSLLLLSICIWLSLGLFLSSVKAVKPWYLAPAIPFVAISTMYGLKWIIDRLPILLYAIPLLFLFTFYMRYFGPKPQASPGSESSDFFTQLVLENKEMFSNAESIVVLGTPPAQRILLELYFTETKIQFQDNPSVREELEPTTLFFIRKAYLRSLQNQLNTLQILQQDENYAILQYKI